MTEKSVCSVDRGASPRRAHTGKRRPMPDSGKTAVAGMGSPTPPSMPAPTPEEQADEADLLQKLRELNQLLKQQNLNRAVELAVQAARGEGPLVDHFAELGRRFGDAHLPDVQPKRRRSLHLIAGGRSEP